jgi:hypothetical protein
VIVDPTKLAKISAISSFSQELIAKRQLTNGIGGVKCNFKHWTASVFRLSILNESFPRRKKEDPQVPSCELIIKLNLFSA